MEKNSAKKDRSSISDLLIVQVSRLQRKIKMIILLETIVLPTDLQHYQTSLSSENHEK